MTKIAVIQTGGKQYLVKNGDVITVEKIEGSKGAGSKVHFDRVLMTDDGAATQVGTPTIANARIEGEILEEGRDDKVTVIRYREKSRYFKKRGHRQPFTKVKISM